MEDSITPGVEEITTPIENADVSSTTGTEAVTKTAENDQQSVPLDRFLEVNSDLKQTKQELAAINEKLASLGAPKVEESGFDSDTERQLQSWAKSQGFVSQRELEAERASIQTQSDLKDLKGKYSLSDTDLSRVREEAAKMGVGDARGLEATYAFLFQDKIIEEKVKQAMAGNTATAEKPGGTASPELPDTQTQKAGMTVQERVRAAMNR
jgi:hypothetical protein